MWTLTAANTTLRFVTLGSRLLLVLLIARFLPPGEVGDFGLLTASLTLSLYVLGMDFYVYNTRELLLRDVGNRAPLVRDQFVFHLLTYGGVLPCLLLLFLGGLLEWRFAPWFYVLLVLEHLSQELHRLLVTYSQPTAANAILLVRSGAWVYPLILWGFMRPGSWTLETVYTFWLIGVTVSAVLGVLALDLSHWTTLRDRAIDWKWLRNGLAVSLPFLCATGALLGIQYADRFFLEYYHGTDVVGAYTFYSSIANGVHAVIYAGVIMVVYPKLVSAYQSRSQSQYRSISKQLTRGVMGWLLLMLAAAIAGIWPVLQLVGQVFYSQYLSVYWILLTSIALLTLSYIPHYALYARQKDRAIVWSSVTALLTAISANVLLVPRYGAHGAACATCLATGVMAFWKFALLKRIQWKERRLGDHWDTSVSAVERQRDILPCAEVCDSPLRRSGEGSLW